MSHVVDSIKGIFTVVKHNKVHIDNVVFRLHYKVTAVLLLIFGILVTERQYIGDPIDCITDGKADKVIDQFCWIHGTYTNLEITEKNNIGYKKSQTIEDDVDYIRRKLANKNDVENPSLSREFFNYKHGSVNDRTFHKYYQWVWCFLIFEAVIFYFPHWLWKTWEGGRVRVFVAELNTFILCQDSKSKQQQAVCDYFCDRNYGKYSVFGWKPRGNHTFYALKYIFCEVLNLINICSQLYLLDSFINKGFSKYGWKLWGITEWRPYARSDYMTQIFPIVTMCEMPIIGYAGGIVGHQAVCVLPINVLNEKIFIFLWCWFLVIMTVTALGICYRALTLFPFIGIRAWLLHRLNSAIPDRVIDTICTQVDYGDWYFLYLLGKNMNPVYYAELIKSLADRLENSGPETEWSNSSTRKNSFGNV